MTEAPIHMFGLIIFILKIKGRENTNSFPCWLNIMERVKKKNSRVAENLT